MVSRCGIAIRMESLTYGIYCHYDGTPDLVGETLRSFYQGRNKALRLVSLGDLTELKKDLGACVLREADFLGPRIFSDLAKFGDTMRGMGADFLYVMDSTGKWWFKDIRDNKYTDLAEFLEADEDA